MMTKLKKSIVKIPVDDNPQVCVCYDVYNNEILEAIHNGADSVEKVSDATYACQGCGSCRLKIEGILNAVDSFELD